MRKSKLQIALIMIMALGLTKAAAQSVTGHVDPRIGSEGLGRVYIGPTLPYGMIKPSPDGVSMPNSGWAPMPEPIKGFSQVHVSGTGGGQKYGNVLLMPFIGNAADGKTAKRATEDISLNRYATTLESGIKVEITSANRAAIYNIEYPKDSEPGLIVDAGAFLGMSDIPDERETQQFVGSQIEIVSDTEVRGYNRVRGGWNNGRAYTVYFYAIADKPFKATTWKGDEQSLQQWQSDTHKPTGAILRWSSDCDDVKIKIGISYLSELKARDNLLSEINDFDFEKVYNDGIDAWQNLLSRIEIAPSASDEQKRMFYTGLYHTMIMPTDRCGENPLWADDATYYDDYYAIWDTYRTSTPMITLIDSERETQLVNSLLNIYKRDGYMPDARSGNANGRTQGGSNAEIMIIDAYKKGLDGIDYEMALEAMLKDADTPPGGLEEAEGRGGLTQYNQLGYVPFGIPRAGNRTVEYAFCDYAIAQLAKALGKDDVYKRFERQSHNWQNLWRDDYEHAGTRGFIMPRDADGVWLDSLTQGHSKLMAPKYEYTAMTFEGTWYTPWWSMFFYEAPSWEYSLSMPHDVPLLIERCGGAEVFEKRLDTFFDKGFYNVNNEPSFLSPCLYHWIGKPHRSTDRVKEIVSANFNDGAVGLPGNDDSGAMSSWLAFHMIGLYPNAGHDYYLINSPMIESSTIHLPNGKDFKITADGFSAKKPYIAKAELNGEPYTYSSIKHSDILKGGELRLTMAKQPGDWGKEMAPESEIAKYERNDEGKAEPMSVTYADGDQLQFVFKLHGQTRRYLMHFDTNDDASITLTWGIERNMKWQEGSMTMTKEAVDNANVMSFVMPVDSEHLTLPSNTTAYIISRKAYQALKQEGKMRYNNTVYTLVDDGCDGVMHVVDGNEGAQMWILDNEKLPIVWRMSDNALEVNWQVRVLQ